MVFSPRLRPFIFVCLLQILVAWCSTPVMATGIPEKGNGAFSAGSDAFGAKSEGERPDPERSADDSTLSPCQKVRQAYDRADFVTLELRSEYCVLKCSFLKYVRCAVDAPKVEFTAFADTKRWFEKFDADKFFVSDREPDMVADEVIGIWWHLVARAWAITLGLFPILCNQSKGLKGSYWLTSGMIFMFGAVHIYGFCSMGIMLNNMLLALLALISPASSPALSQYFLMTLGTFAAAWSAFLTSPALQVPITFAVLAGYVTYMQAAFFHRGKNTSFGGVAVVLIQIIILTEQLHIAVREFGLKSYVAMLLEYVIVSYLPHGGSKWLLFNSIFASQRLARVMDCAKFGLNPGLVAMNLVFVQITMFLFSRACIGSYYLYSLRCRFEAQALVLGFWTYLIDVLGPVRGAYLQFFGLETMDSRKVLYSTVGLIMAATELRYAYEFFIIRCFFFLVDWLFIRSPYGKATHYLSSDVDCDGAYLHELFDHARTHNVLSDGVYPHPTAGAWHDAEKLCKLGQCVGTLKVLTKSDDRVRGVGMAVASRGRTVLYSVAHVTDNAASVVFQNRRLQDPQFEAVCTSDDPVTSTVCDLPHGPHLPLLTKPEIGRVTTMICLNRVGGEKGLDGKVVQAYVRDWSVDKHSGTLRVCANLREGDSGGPLIAVLTGGDFRYAGSVSMGSTAAPGNHVSLVVPKTDVYESDSDSDHCVRQFNAVRRHSGRMSEGDVEYARYQAHDELASWFSRNGDLLNELKEWPAHFQFDHFPDCDDRASEVYQAFVRKAGNGGTIRGRDAHDPGDADDAGGDGPSVNRPGRNKRRKNARKDRAAIKNAGLKFELLRERLLRIYSEEDAKAIFNLVMHGKLLTLPQRGYVGKVQDGLITIADDLPGSGDWG